MDLFLLHTYHDISCLGQWINESHQAQFLSSLTEIPLFMPESVLRERTVIPDSSLYFNLLHTHWWRSGSEAVQHLESFLLLQAWGGLKGPVWSHPYLPETPPLLCLPAVVTLDFSILRQTMLLLASQHSHMFFPHLAPYSQLNLLTYQTPHHLEFSP